MTALLDLAREELAAVLAGEWERLDELAARRAAVLDALPDRIDEDVAREVLHVHEAIDAALHERLAAVRGELGGLHRSRGAARAYGEH